MPSTFYQQWTIKSIFIFYFLIFKSKTKDEMKNDIFSKKKENIYQIPEKHCHSAFLL